jgi:hypothetical protein
MTAVNFTKSFGVRCVLLRTKHLVRRFLRKRPFLKDLLFVRFAEHLAATLARRWEAYRQAKKWTLTAIWRKFRVTA